MIAPVEDRSLRGHMPQDAMGREPGSPGYQKPGSTKKKGLLARLRERARSSRHKPKLTGKATGTETGTNFKSAAQNRGAALRELTGSSTTPAESASVAKKRY